MHVNRNDDEAHLLAATTRPSATGESLAEMPPSPMSPQPGSTTHLPSSVAVPSPRTASHSHSVSASSATILRAAAAATTTTSAAHSPNVVLTAATPGGTGRIVGASQHFHSVSSPLDIPASSRVSAFRLCVCVCVCVVISSYSVVSQTSWPSKYLSGFSPITITNQFQFPMRITLFSVSLSLSLPPTHTRRVLLLAYS